MAYNERELHLIMEVIMDKGAINAGIFMILVALAPVWGVIIMWMAGFR